MVEMSGEGAVAAALRAALRKVGWVPEFGAPDQPTKAMPVAYLTCSGQKQRALGFRRLAFVEEEAEGAHPLGDSRE